MIKTLSKPDQNAVIQQFVCHLANQCNCSLQVDSWPDKEKGTSKEIDATAGHFAIEHTSVDTVLNQRRDAAWFLQVTGSLEEEFCGKLPFRLIVILPYEGIQAGQDWSQIRAMLRSWIIEEAFDLLEGSHIIGDVSGVPFKFRVIKRASGQPRLLFARNAPKDDSFFRRLREQLDRKAEKLLPYKKQGRTTVLLIESDDIALMDEAIMWDSIRLAYPDGLPRGVDQIWFADTSIPEHLLFVDLTAAVSR
jgi:hypothetical protein